jgi:hypothetical protein
MRISAWRLPRVSHTCPAPRAASLSGSHGCPYVAETTGVKFARGPGDRPATRFDCAILSAALIIGPSWVHLAVMVATGIVTLTAVGRPLFLLPAIRRPAGGDKRRLRKTGSGATIAPHHWRGLRSHGVLHPFPVTTQPVARRKPNCSALQVIVPDNGALFGRRCRSQLQFLP